MLRALRILLGVALIGAVFAPPAGAIPYQGGRIVRSSTEKAPGVHKQPKIVEKWQAEKAAAADLVARGKATVEEDGTVELKNGKRVEHRLEGTDHIVTLLAEFTDPQAGQIAEPDRSTDNSTYWVPNFNRAHYRDMLFSDGGGSYGMPSMRDYYRETSVGRYTVTGQVSEWVSINQPESFYGANSRADGDGSDNLNGPVYRVVRDALLATQTQNEDINWSPSVVDVWDRYDCDGDGIINESDGYVDHFQIVHAGQGEEEGGGAQGGDAIWSHRWYANFNDEEGPEGPASCKLGGYAVPGTGLWVGDYTIEPENGAVGVFAHEFGHDLGLPDHYDTTNLSENGTGFWTIMSSGSWASYDEDAIGTIPVHFTAWDKLVLGWLDTTLATASAGQDKTFKLGPAEWETTGRFQALRVNLPNYSRTDTVFPVDGSDANYYYSTQGDNIDTRMTRMLSSPLASATTLSFRANWDIETDWDYAYVEAYDGATWKPINGNLSSTTNPNGQNFGFGITGSSGGWTTGSYTLPAGTQGFRFRYWTDGFVTEPGFAVDSISLGSFSDNGTTPSNWTFNGFLQLTNGQYTKTYFHYYLAESRNYLGNDRSLCGAYNFISGNWLEKQCYANGLLIWYRNSGFADNNTALHPGGGSLLPVDSHPAALKSPFGRDYLRTRWQTWDAPFTVDAHSVTLTEQQGPNRYSKTYNSAAVKSFYDSSKTAYYNTAIPYNSVKTAGSGIRIDITGVSADRTTYSVRLWKP